VKKGDQLPLASGMTGAPAARFVWGDRLMFAVAGLVLGFAAAYLYLDKAPQATAADPHAGLNLGPGASRDLPGSGGGAPPISVEPALRQKISELQGAVAREPASYDLLVQLGNAAYDAQDPHVAIDAYERALKVKDGDPNVLTDLGVSYRNAGDSDKAFACFERALKSDPKHWQAQFNEAIVLGVDRKDKKRAMEILDRLKKEHPEVSALASLEEMIKRS
jgi:tetratricopeptide (TPR) repeat protein